jgi:hypothetical protein
MKRETLLSVVGLLVVGTILAVAFRAYLHPDFALGLGSLLLFCM